MDNLTRKAIAELFGFALTTGTMDEVTHWHQCAKCKLIWGHKAVELVTAEEHKDGHTCECGSEQYDKCGPNGERWTWELAERVAKAEGIEL